MGVVRTYQGFVLGVDEGFVLELCGEFAMREGVAEGCVVQAKRNAVDPPNALRET